MTIQFGKTRSLTWSGVSNVGSGHLFVQQVNCRWKNLYVRGLFEKANGRRIHPSEST